MDVQKLIDDLMNKKQQCENKLEYTSDYAKWCRTSGQLSVLNNILDGIKRGKYK